MFEFHNKIKRQIEILGLCLEDDNSKHYSAVDLAEIFGVEEITVKRDLQELRAIGIDIHSTKRRGIKVHGGLTDKVIKAVILHYVGINYPEQIADRSTNLLVKKKKIDALKLIIDLQIAVDNRNIIIIDYQKVESGLNENIELRPLLIFQNEGSYRLLVQDDDYVKQYHLDKIVACERTARTFTRIDQKVIDDLFVHSWRSWIGKERHKVKLQLSPELADWVTPRMWIQTQRSERLPDGSIIFEVTVNSLREIASWIVSRGKGCKVLEPKELKQMVIKIANETLKNYD